MDRAVIDSFAAGVDGPFGPVVRTLAEAVVAAAPELDCWTGYGMLMFGRASRRSEWLCGISTSTKAVQLRFLRGDLLSDPAAILRPGSSTLKTIDVQPADAVDADLVATYVREAVAASTSPG